MRGWDTRRVMSSNPRGGDRWVTRTGSACLQFGTVLDARGFFAATRPPEHQNEFGFNVSGPIVKNRIFFFGSYDGFVYRTGTTPTLVTIPSLKERTGDFSELAVPIYDPKTLTTVN